MAFMVFPLHFTRLLSILLLLLLLLLLIFYLFIYLFLANGFKINSQVDSGFQTLLDSGFHVNVDSGFHPTGFRILLHGASYCLNYWGQLFS